MAANHVAAVVRKYRRGRSDRRIAADANIPLHWLAYPLRPGTELKTMPDDDRIAVLARAIGAPYAELHEAFELDVEGEEPYETLRGQEQDPQMQQLVRLAVQLDTHHRGTLVAMARSLNTLQRRTTAIETRDIREVG